MKICSFLPSATEMVCALGLEDDLVGVTHECDFPPSVREKPVVVRSVLDTLHMAPEEIDRRVSERLRAGESLYEIDEPLIAQLRPDLILAQDLCEVCAPASAQAQQAKALLATRAEVAYLTPHSLSDILENILQVGRLTHRVSQAEILVRSLRQRLDAVADKTKNLFRPKVFCMEWVNPVYNAGHWVPEMVAIAGGEDRLAQAGKDSCRLPWEQVLAYKPEVLFIMPCGYNAEGAAGQLELLRQYPEWESLPAVQSGLIYALDASSYFARPGPRVVEGVELMAHLMHPEAVNWNGSHDAFRRFERLNRV